MGNLKDSSLLIKGYLDSIELKGYFINPKLIHSNRISLLIFKVRFSTEINFQD